MAGSLQDLQRVALGLIQPGLYVFLFVCLFY